MKKFRKLFASITALTTAFSISIGTLAVTANGAKKAIDVKSAYNLKDHSSKIENKISTELTEKIKEENEETYPVVIWLENIDDTLGNRSLNYFS